MQRKGRHHMSSNNKKGMIFWMILHNSVFSVSIFLNECRGDERRLRVEFLGGNDTMTLICLFKRSGSGSHTDTKMSRWKNGGMKQGPALCPKGVIRLHCKVEKQEGERKSGRALVAITSLPFSIQSNI